MAIQKNKCIMGMTFIMLIYSMVSLSMDYGETRDLSLLSEDIVDMEIDCGAGFLKVTGVEGLDEIMVKAEIVAGNKDGDELNEFIDDYVTLSLDRENGKAILKSKFERSITSKLFNWKVKQHINLTVAVPVEMNMAITDGSGSIELENIKGEIDIIDGSGSMSLKNIKGPLMITDGSGELNIYDVEGETEIQDGSGSIKIEGIHGDLNINDGSGSLWAADINGSVTINDGSGSIHIDGVSGNVDIVESGSGGVLLNNVNGKVIGDI